MKQIIQITAVGLLALNMHAADSADPPDAPLLQMRLVAEGPGEETEKMVLEHERNGEVNRQELYVQQEVLLDESDVKEAEPGQNRISGKPVIQLHFTEDGRKKFARVTRENEGRMLAIIIGGELQSAPRINEPILGSRASISGNFDETRAKALIEKLNEAAKQ